MSRDRERDRADARADTRADTRPIMLCSSYFAGVGCSGRCGKSHGDGDDLDIYLEQKRGNSCRYGNACRYITLPILCPYHHVMTSKNERTIAFTLKRKQDRGDGYRDDYRRAQERINDLEDEVRSVTNRNVALTDEKNELLARVAAAEAHAAAAQARTESLVVAVNMLTQAVMTTDEARRNHSAGRFNPALQ